MDNGLRLPVLSAPDDAGALVRHAEELYRNDRDLRAAELWLRRARRLAPGAGFVLHSSALAARRSADRAGAARWFRAVAVVDLRAMKALSRLVDDLDAQGCETAAGRICRWLSALGMQGSRIEIRVAIARLHAAADWDAVALAIATMSTATAAETATAEALWSVCSRLPGVAAANAAWRCLADRAGGAAGPAMAAGVTGIAMLSSGPAIAAWNAKPVNERRVAAAVVQRSAPSLRPLVEAALVASIELAEGTLLDAFRSARPVAVDIGARGMPLGDIPLLPAVATVLAVDADDGVTRQLSADLGNLAGWYDLRPMTVALAERAEARTFRLTRQRGLSSLLNPNKEIASVLGISDGIEVLEHRAVDAVPLMAVLDPLGLPAPSHLKLDTQGTELEILRGAWPVVRDHALSVQVEVEFRALYEGQPLFGDVDRFLVECGLELVLLRRTRRRLGNATAEVPSRLELGWGHALYMRTLEGFTKRQPGWPEVVRYCTVAMAYRLTDRALMLLAHPLVDGRFPQARPFAAALRSYARAWPEQLDDSQGRGYRKDRW